MSDANAREQLKDAILLAALPHVAFDGWSMVALGAGATDLGLAKQDLLHAFPNGVADAIAHWSDWADHQAVQAMAAADIAHLKTHQRVAMGVWARLQALGRWRDAARKATAWLAAPRHAALASRLAYRTCDAIWRAAGDVSTDFNFYTKRALLAGVVLSTTLYWLQDSSEGYQASSAFLDRRIADVLRIGGRIGKARAALERFDPLALLHRFHPTA
ncbi:MAG: ubiquinone biosynthesis protein [Rhodospirillales bacterium]|nr:ubiquinone biosynthesis protein [Rhodospirillales bacterium]